MRRMSVSSGSVVRVALAVVILAAIVMPVAAQADHCSSGEFCVWGNTAFTGDHIARAGDENVWPCGTLCSPDVDENEDSLKNRESHKVRVYSLDNYDGALMYCVPGGVSEDDIADSRDNDGSSHRGSSGSSCPSGEPLP